MPNPEALHRLEPTEPSTPKSFEFLGPKPSTLRAYWPPQKGFIGVWGSWFKVDKGLGFGVLERFRFGV